MIAQFTQGTIDKPEVSILELVGNNLEVSSMLVDNGDLIVRLYNSDS